MFGIGMPELLVIFVIALLVFGPQELPKIGRTIGRAMGELRRASDDLKEGIQREMDAAEREAQEREAAEREAAERARAAAAAPAAPVQGGEATAAIPATPPEGTQPHPAGSASAATDSPSAPVQEHSAPVQEHSETVRADGTNGEPHTTPPGGGPAPAIPADRPAGTANV